MGTARKFESIDAAIMDVLSDVFVASGRPYRQVSVETGVSLGRLSAIANCQAAAASPGEIDLIARAAGSDFFEIVTEAKTRLAQTQSQGTQSQSQSINKP